jgi:hypothetical protein
MFNPLLPELSSLKNEDIDNKINELMRKYTIAARSGQGIVCQQIIVILETYKAEQQKRHIAGSQKLLDQGKNLDDFVNVDR